MNYIFDHPDHPQAYPAVFLHVKQAFPNIAFPAGITLAELSGSPEFHLYLVTPTTEPDYDPATHKLVELPPTGSGSSWAQAWSVVALSEEELVALNPPDFVGFQLAALTTPAFQAMWQAAFATAPTYAVSLPALLLQVGQGGASEPLIAAFDAVVAAGQPSQADLAQFQSAAQYFRLPAALVYALIGKYIE